MINDYEDDTHYCLKCHKTILGLDNYVNHRKSKCGKNLENVELSKSNVLQPALKADDFFSSLELQSSSKKIQSSGGKSFSGVLTRSKASAVIQASSSIKEPYQYLGQNKNDNIWTDNKNSKKEEASTMHVYGDSDEESEECEYEEESEYDDDEENQDVPPRSFTGGKWKPTSSPIQWLRPPSSNTDHDWTSSPMHYTEHADAKWKSKDFESKSDNFENKKKLKSDELTSWEYQDRPPSTYTKGKWKPAILRSSHSESDGLSPMFTKGKWRPGDHEDADDEIPPPTHTKGKWKPRSNKDPEDDHPSSTYTKGKWKPEENVPSSYAKGKWRAREDDVPPPTHTKGKWKPRSSEEVEENQPPPTYTKGKWKPKADDIPPPTHTKGKGKRKDSEEVEVPEIDLHMSSELENESFVDSRGGMEYWCAPCGRILPSKISYEHHLKLDYHQKRISKDYKFDKEDFVRRSADFVFCDVCKLSVNIQIIGKHLISDYHCCRSKFKSEEAIKMILDNIHVIVLQSPYQCKPCNFYFNTHEWLLDHWRKNHKNVVLKDGLYFSCSICKYQTAHSELLIEHMQSKEHKEIISVINPSVPVVLKKLVKIACDTCGMDFLYNIQLRRHCESEGHPYNVISTAINNKLKCVVCSLAFNTMVELKKHRSSPEHGRSVLENRQRKTQKDLTPKTCTYCAKRCDNMMKLRKHLKTKHPEYNHSCRHCGKNFEIPQDLTVHIKTNSCSFDEKSTKLKSCDECRFNTNSASEFLCHKILHGDSLLLSSQNKGTSTGGKQEIPHYMCPFCGKYYGKSYLRFHLRLHTKEREFVCAICGTGFFRRSNWTKHMKSHDKNNAEKPKKRKRSLQLGERLFLCSTCGASFKKRAILKQHMTRHTGKSCKCSKTGCVFSARSPAELKIHLLTHSDEKPFACTSCDYRGKTKQQLDRHTTIHNGVKNYRCTECSFTTRLSSHLKRHLRIHTGAKPFVCPHCDYCSNDIDNLRKHILSTNKHPGKCMYECKFCEEEPYETNFAKEFKVHLITEHPETFVFETEAVSFIAGLYQTPTDDTAVQGFLDPDEKERSNRKQEEVEDALSQFQDSSVSRTSNNNVGPAVLLTSVTTQDSSEHKIHDELFPIVSKNVVCIENPSVSWNIGGNYDVEESSSLVPFHAEGETLLHENFQ